MNTALQMADLYRRGELRIDAHGELYLSAAGQAAMMPRMREAGIEVDDMTCSQIDEFLQGTDAFRLLQAMIKSESVTAPPKEPGMHSKLIADVARAAGGY